MPQLYDPEPWRRAGSGLAAGGPWGAGGLLPSFLSPPEAFAPLPPLPSPAVPAPKAAPVAGYPPELLLADIEEAEAEERAEEEAARDAARAEAEEANPFALPAFLGRVSRRTSPLSKPVGPLGILGILANPLLGIGSMAAKGAFTQWASDPERYKEAVTRALAAEAASPGNVNMAMLRREAAESAEDERRAQLFAGVKQTIAEAPRQVGIGPYAPEAIAHIKDVLPPFLEDKEEEEEDEYEEYERMVDEAIERAEAGAYGL